jgi:hypothetical protein
MTQVEQVVPVGNTDVHSSGRILDRVLRVRNPGKWKVDVSELSASRD